MTQPIMSRFDLFFVITDQSLEFIDQQIATHIVRLHSKMERAINPMFKTEELQKYLRFCRTFKPIFTRDAAEFLKSAYTRLR
jgi:DNA replication licensing factor MCM6